MAGGRGCHARSQGLPTWLRGAVGVGSASAQLAGACSGAPTSSCWSLAFSEPQTILGRYPVVQWAQKPWGTPLGPRDVSVPLVLVAQRPAVQKETLVAFNDGAPWGHSHLCVCVHMCAWTCVCACGCMLAHGPVCACTWTCVCSVSYPPPSLPGPKLRMSGSSSLGERGAEMPTSGKICLLGHLASPARGGKWNSVQIMAPSREGCVVCARSIHCPVWQCPAPGPRVDT